MIDLLPEDSIAAILLLIVAGVLVVALWWRGQPPFRRGLEAAFWALLSAVCFGFLAALFQLPRWIAVDVAPLLILIGFLVAFVTRTKTLLERAPDWAWFGVGFGLMEVLGKLIRSALSAVPFSISLVVLLPFLVQFLLAVSVCAMIRSGMSPIITALVAGLLVLAHKLSADIHTALVALGMVLLSAGVLKWGERFNRVTTGASHANTPP